MSFTSATFHLVVVNAPSFHKFATPLLGMYICVVALSWGVTIWSNGSVPSGTRWYLFGCTVLCDQFAPRRKIGNPSSRSFVSYTFMYLTYVSWNNGNWTVNFRFRLLAFGFRFSAFGLRVLGLGLRASKLVFRTLLGTSLRIMSRYFCSFYWS
jgi:hypothetical protein